MTLPQGLADFTITGCHWPYPIRTNRGILWSQSRRLRRLVEEHPDITEMNVERSDIEAIGIVLNIFYGSYQKNDLDDIIHRQFNDDPTRLINVFIDLDIISNDYDTLIKWVSSLESFYAMRRLLVIDGAPVFNFPELYRVNPFIRKLYTTLFTVIATCPVLTISSSLLIELLWSYHINGNNITNFFEVLGRHELNIKIEDLPRTDEYFFNQVLNNIHRYMIIRGIIISPEFKRFFFQNIIEPIMVNDINAKLPSIFGDLYSKRFHN